MGFLKEVVRLSPFVEFLILLASVPLWIASLQAVLTRLGLGKIIRSGQLTVLVSSIVAAFPLGVCLRLVYLKALSPDELAKATIYAASVYGLLAYSYFHVFNMSETARRIRILFEIKRRGRLGKEELKSIYNARIMVENRIERLISMGQLKEKGGSYVLNSRALYYIACMIAGWGKLLGLPSPRRYYKKD